MVATLLAASFEPREVPLKNPSDAQREVLVCLVECQELWSIANLYFTFETYGLPHDRDKCANLAGTKYMDDKALAALSIGVQYSKMGFLEKGRNHIDEALKHDPTIFNRTPSPDECWFFCAKAFAEIDAKRAMEAFRNAVSINPQIAHRVDPAWTLSELLVEEQDTE